MALRFHVACVALAVTGFVMVSSHGYAAEEKNATDYPVLAKLQGDDATLTYDYLGEKYGLDAWLLSGPELMQVIYVLPQDKTAIVGGTLVNPDGKEASSTLLQNFLKRNPERASEILQHVRGNDGDAEQDKSEATEKAPAQKSTAQSPSEKFWNNLSAIGGITFGDNKDAPEIFAVLDPAQPDTKLVWNILGPLAEKKHLRVHIVPLAATTADSIMDVAYVLGDKNPQQAWEDLLKGKKPDVTGSPESHGVLRMKAIVDLAQSMNLRQLPLLVYRVGAQQDKAGTVRIIRGTPKNWITLFREAGMADEAMPAKAAK